jgi:exoribonuclease R
MSFEKCYQQNIKYPVNEWNSFVKKFPNGPNANPRKNFFYPVYTIDPEGCQDVDDGFSVYFRNDKLFLSIHIADPTHYFNVHRSRESLFQEIRKRGMTYYPSGYNSQPIHMLPRDVLNQSSLHTDKECDFKFTLTITTEIDQTTYLPVSFSEDSLQFCVIEVRPENKYTYSQASQTDIFGDALKISKKMRQNRKDSIKIRNKNGLKFLSDSHIHIYQYSEKEIEIKEMIEEFAIFANMYIGEYLKHNNDILQYRGIFRSCDANVFVERYKNSDENIYKQLIKNNIIAEYTDDFRTHDMIACDKMYTHFTSPIRRFSDCLCHFLLKYIYLKKIGNNIQNVANPFTEPELKNMIKEVHIKTKQNKKISYLDQKFRKIQAIFCLLQNMNQKQNINDERKYIIAECEVISYKSGFVNILITHIISNLTYSKLNINLSCSFWKKNNIDIEHFKAKISTIGLYSYLNDLYIPFTQSGKIKDNEVFPEIYQMVQEL